jgi:hypothetical protein
MTALKAQGENTSWGRAAVQLNAALDRHLLSYAAAAAATGVGLLALAPSAQAKVVYHPADVTIQPNHVANLDLNGDGIQDFFLFASAVSSGVPTSLSIDPVRPNNRILGNNVYASALPAGVSVGPGGQFQQEHDLMATNVNFYFHLESRGPWKGKQESYLGLRFIVQGEAHYGWARVSIDATKYPMSITLTGCAYETDANTAIVTGATSGTDETGANSRPDLIGPSTGRPLASLGALAQGSAGLAPDAPKLR